MTKEQFSALFPCNVGIPQIIIDKAELFDVTNCVGANVLKGILQAGGVEYNNVSWGRMGGFIALTLDDYSYTAIIHSDKDMMEIKAGEQASISLNAMYPVY